LEWAFLRAESAPQYRPRSRWKASQTPSPAMSGAFLVFKTALRRAKRRRCWHCRHGTLIAASAISAPIAAVRRDDGCWDWCSTSSRAAPPNNLLAGSECETFEMSLLYPPATEQRDELAPPIKKLTAHETAAAGLSSTEKPSSARRLTRRRACVSGRRRSK
jgi:hypothetical protein